MTNDQKNQLIKDCLKVCDIDLSEKQVDLIARVVNLVNEKGEDFRVTNLRKLVKDSELKNYHESKK
jgi:hypothetical protein